ncbi:MAG: LacI family DNA-binding transcriptional regulator [Aquaticitalea sp.]
MHQSATTLKKISLISGYSVSTVSKALNDKQDISLETRQTIMNIAKKHNYVPNYYAMALRKQQTKTLAIIIPKISDSFYGNLLSEIQNLSFELGYRLIVFQSFTSPKKEKECFKLINDGSVDGVMVFSAAENECIIEKLQYEGIVPTVFLKENAAEIRKNDVEDLAKMYFNDLLLKVL